MAAKKAKKPPAAAKKPREAPLKAGDIVFLKSGSPAMTITFANEFSGEINCSWFDANGNPGSGQFNWAALTRDEPPRPY